MSLSSWFRDYVYIPMGGNRVTMVRWLFNIAIVWMLTGFWHGAAWNFVLWGLMFAALLIIEKLFLGEALKKIPRLFSHIYVSVLVVISFVLFNAVGLEGAVSDLRGLFGYPGLPFTNAETLYYMRSYAVVLIIAIIGATPLAKNISKKLKGNDFSLKTVAGIEPVILSLLFILVTAYLVDGSFNPFLYFRF